MSSVVILLATLMTATMLFVPRVSLFWSPAENITVTP